VDLDAGAGAVADIVSAEVRVGREAELPCRFVLAGVRTAIAALIVAVVANLPGAGVDHAVAAAVSIDAPEGWESAAAAVELDEEGGAVQARGAGSQIERRARGGGAARREVAGHRIDAARQVHAHKEGTVR